jgi:HPt (histidine-containing phosphotransfer) domain-containing protein
VELTAGPPSNLISEMATPPSTSSPMTDALNRMWARFLPEIQDRLLIVEDAAIAAEGLGLSLEQREVAHQAAHKLAGILGTFGLPRGTELARLAEHLLAADVSAASAAELTAWLVELRSLIQSRAS